MEYRVVGARCAFDFGCLPPEARESADGILESLGFRGVEVDLLALARSCIGSSRFVKRADPVFAPEVVNCSSFTRWLFGQRGIWLPRLCVQQRSMGWVVEPQEAMAHDLLFTTAHFSLYADDPSDGVGHVGIVTERRTVIHAKGRKSGVVEEALDKFLAPAKFRGLRRLIEPGHEVWTLEIPPSAFVETSDDIRWMVIQSHFGKRPKVV
jgi:hypothetical protein